jgi:hypothetical protein
MGGITLVTEMCELSADVRTHFKRVRDPDIHDNDYCVFVLDGAELGPHTQKSPDDRLFA